MRIFRLNRVVLLSLGLVAPWLAGCASSGTGGAPAAAPAAEPTEAAGSAVEAELPPKPLTPAQRAALKVESVEVRPAEMALEVGETLRPEVVALDSEGREVDGVQLRRFVRGRAAVYDSDSGEIEAVEPGEATLLAGLVKPAAEGGSPEMLFARARIVVRPLPVARLELDVPAGPLYSGTRVRAEVAAFSEIVKENRDDGASVIVFEGKRCDVAWSSSDPSVAEVTPNGFVLAKRPGSATLTATSEGVNASTEVVVIENPVRNLTVEPALEEVQVGDVTRFSVVALDSRGRPVPNVPVEWTAAGLSGQPVESALMLEDGTFVASMAGMYRVTATIGETVAVAEVSSRARPGRRSVEKVAHAPIPEHSTSDLH